MDKNKRAESFSNKKAVLKGKETSGAQLCLFIYGLLKRRAELSPAVKEFNEIDGTLKTYFKGVPEFCIGGYCINGGAVCKKGN